MTIREILDATNTEKILYQMALHYGYENQIKYRYLCSELRKKVFTVNAEKMIIHIDVYGEKEGDYFLIEEFNENDINLYFDVSAKQQEDEMVYSIAAIKYEEFLNYDIDQDTLNKLSFESILAHCLWEITTYGFCKE